MEDCYLFGRVVNASNMASRLLYRGAVVLKNENIVVMCIVCFDPGIVYNLFYGFKDSDAVFPWEPVLCHDSVQMGWSTLSLSAADTLLGMLVLLSFYPMRLGNDDFDTIGGMPDVIPVVWKTSPIFYTCCY